MILPATPPTISAYFVIAGRDIDFSQCTKSIGIEPTEVWRQQHEHLKGMLEIPNTNWIIHVKCQDYSIDDSLQKILDVIWPRRNKIRRYAKANSLKLAFICNIKIIDDRPVYSLSPETIKKIAWFGAKFGLDIADYSE